MPCGRYDPAMPPEHIDVLGSVISVDIPPADLDRIRAQWSRCMAQPDRTPVASVVYGSQDDADRRDYGLASALTLAGITRAAGTRLMLHAAGVADPGTGRVAVLVAASGTGKTTAARRLCTAGFGYVTDETVSIGADDDVLAYPKPLSVVIAGDSPHHKSQHGPDELGLPPCPADPRAALFVLLDRDGDDPGAAPALDRVPLLDGLIALIPQTSALPAMPRPLQTLAGAVQRAGGVWRLRYHDVEDATDLLRDAVLADPVEPSDVTAFPAPLDRSSRPPSVTSTSSAGLADGSQVIRAPYLDAIGIDDEVLVLIDTRPVRLSGLGATIWTGSARATSVNDLIARCVAEHGEHPQAGDLVRDAIRELLRHDTLQLTQ